MREVQKTKRFLKDFAKAKRPDFREEIRTIVYLLMKDGELPSDYDAHPLYWQWAGFWDVHLDDDWILVYRITERRIRLVRLVRHKELRESKP